MGDAAVLTHQYKNREFLQVLLPTGLGLVMIVFAFSSLYIFIKRRAETQYFWFALAMALFCVDTFNVFLTDIPVNRIVWEIYVQATVFSFASSVLIFIHRFTGTGWRSVEGLLAVFLILQIVILSLTKESYFYTIKNLFNISVLLYGCILTVLIARLYLKTSSYEAGITALAGIILLALSIHTWFIHSGIISPENLHTIHYAGPGFFILISFSLLTKFLSSLTGAEELARTLDQRVQDKKRELVASYDRIKDLEQRQAIADERVRIMRDIHDGFGGQLLGAISMTHYNKSSMEDISKHLRNALMDLRIMIDSLDPHTQELTVALGMLKTRIQPMLESKDVLLIWDVGGVPDSLSLNPRMTLSILRVLQESFTNIAKHSIGRSIRLVIKFIDQITNKTLKIRIWEDGKGFDPRSTAGRGLLNIRQRISELQGNIVHQAFDNGFETHIIIPVHSTNSG